MSEVDELYHEANRLLGVSDSSMTVLYMALDCGGSCALSEIRRETGVPKQTLNSALRKLESDGVVRLEGGARDRRVVLTETGTALARDTAGRLRAIEDEALACWTQEEMRTYLALSERFLDCFAELVATLPSHP